MNTIAEPNKQILMTRDNELKPTGEFTHLDADGRARMVDIGDKDVSRRIAIAEGLIEMEPATLEQLKNQTLKKGDVLAVARVAAIMAAKDTSRLIPLCHPIRLDKVEIEFTYLNSATLSVNATAQATERTGVEMEALVAVSVACLTIYDMCKAIDRAMEIRNIRLLEKTGGVHGDYQRNS